MAVSRSQLVERTGKLAADIDLAALLLAKRKVHGMNVGVDQVRRGGRFETVEVYYTDRAATMIGHVLSNQDVHRPRPGDNEAASC